MQQSADSGWEIRRRGGRFSPRMSGEREYRMIMSRYDVWELATCQLCGHSTAVVYSSRSILSSCVFLNRRSADLSFSAVFFLSLTLWNRYLLRKERYQTLITIIERDVNYKRDIKYINQLFAWNRTRRVCASCKVIARKHLCYVSQIMFR